jgi:hypothetical protein
VAAFRDRDARVTLSYMAEAWLRLAERDDFIPPVAAQQTQPVLQQQQQIQPTPREPYGGCPGMEKDHLILKRASASRPSGEWNEDDYEVLAEGVVVGRIMKVHAAPVGSPWMWTLAFGQREDRTPRHGYAATREAAMAAFAKSWRRE